MGIAVARVVDSLRGAPLRPALSLPPLVARWRAGRPLRDLDRRRTQDLRYDDTTRPAATAPPECGSTRQFVIANMSMSPIQKDDRLRVGGVQPLL
jgi:hypothetical protein